MEQSLPLVEFETKLGEVEANFDFIEAAKELRPRLNDILNQQIGAGSLSPAKKFIESKTNSVEFIYSGLFVQTIAGFERFIRQLIGHTANQIAKSVDKIDKLPSKFNSRHIVLTGKALATFEKPRDFQNHDFQKLIKNLASCTPENINFEINSQVFSFEVTSSTPPIIENALKNIHVEIDWDLLGKNPGLEKLLSAKGARATGKSAKQKWADLCKWRNGISHAGDFEVTISKQNLIETIEFLKIFSKFLHSESQKQFLPSKRGN